MHLISHPQLQKLNAEMTALEGKYSQMQSAIFKDLCEKVFPFYAHSVTVFPRKINVLEFLITCNRYYALG